MGDLVLMIRVEAWKAGDECWSVDIVLDKGAIGPRSPPRHATREEALAWARAWVRAWVEGLTIAVEVVER